MMPLDPAVGEFIRDVTGLEAERVGASAIETAVRECMAQTETTDTGEFVARLHADEVLRQRFINALTVPETWFFRDEVPFEFLAAYLREQVVNQKQRITALSIPCASGEEAYSIAITAHAAGVPAARCHVDAVDINTDLLSFARAGIYGENSFRSPLATWRSGYFESVDGRHRISDAVRDYVEFHRGNLFDFPAELSARRYDVVFFRNLLIYLNHELQQRALELIGDLLKPGGLLFVGHAEAGLVKSARFAAVERGGAFAFRRVPAGEAGQIPEQPGAVPRESRGYRGADRRVASPGRSNRKAAAVVPLASGAPALLPVVEPKSLDDCWNRIGTWGREQPRCERLEAVGTCINCSVYRQAGHDLLNRQAPQGYLEEWRAFLATPLRKGDSKASFYLLFMAQRQLFALHTGVLEYVADAAVIRRLPHRRDPLLLGVAVVKNEVVPCIALARLVGHQASRQVSDEKPADYRRFIVVQFDDKRWIFPVDDVVALQRFERSQIGALDTDAAALPFFSGTVSWENKRVLLIDERELGRRLGEMGQ